MKDEAVPTDLRAECTAAAEAGDGRLDELLDRHYGTLRALAGRVFAGEPAGSSLSPTALVHEAYVELIDQPRASSRGTLFFRACFARQCRRILVDHARRRRAQRRGGDRHDESLRGQTELGIDAEIGVIDIHDAIEKLGSFDARLARIADLRLFSGLSIAECAEALGVSPRTVVKDWGFAQGYLQRELR